MKIKYTHLIIGVMLLTTLTGSCKKDKQGEGEFLTEQATETLTPEQRVIAAASARTLGLAYLEENQLEEAEKEFLRLIDLAANEALGYTNLGIVYIRMGKYAQAEEQLEKAILLDPDDADIRLNLSTAYALLGKEEESKQELETSLKIDSTHVQSLYILAETYGRSGEANSLQEWEKNLNKIVQILPGNIVARLHLIEALIRNHKSKEALKHLEEIERVYPEFPMDAKEHYQKAINELQLENHEEALKASIIFHNILKLTNFYQANIQELRGSKDGTIGIPMITFSQPSPAFMGSGGSILETIKFTDVTELADLGMVANLIGPEQASNNYPHLAVDDFDRDGDSDIYLGNPESSGGDYKHYLFSNEFGRFQDIAQDIGLQHSGIEYSSSFIDYDNDGFLDLYIVKQGQNILYKNVSEGTFEDVTKQAGLSGTAKHRQPLFFDFDHEGDLDLFIISEGTNAIYRNNADGTFTNLSPASVLKGMQVISRDAVFGDFDDDGDVDLFVVNEDASNALYTNMRNGIFRDVTEVSGLVSHGGSTAAASGDYNNDGYLDLFITGSDGGHYLMRNKGDGTFEADPKSTELNDILQNMTGFDAEFFDFDNDGYLDLLVSGQSTDAEGRGLKLFHNDRQGGFEDVSGILPEGINGVRQLALADYNQDGDLDIYLTGTHGGFRLLRNDGGNANHHLKVQLVGIRNGSGKNNHFGIGAKVEVRAAYEYQMRTVTGPTTYFGLGSNDGADVIRILWTNGVPQNIFSPGSDQDLIEQQLLKGSCPFLYTWNGEEYVFVKDMMWRSALGMPMGIMGDKATYSFADASEEYLKIPGEMLQAENGLLKIQVTSELWETIYMDELFLMAVDHPESSDIYLDERFTAPPFPDYRIYSVPAPIPPLSATDSHGNDLTTLILDKDHKYISNFKHQQYQGITELHHLILDLGDRARSDSLYLFMNGWIFPTDASINVAISQTDKMNLISPYLQVKDKRGNWVTVIENMGFPLGKNKTMIIDLTGKFLSNDRTVRISTNMEIYWDQIFYSDCPAKAPVYTRVMKPKSADLHYRGFSEMYRMGTDGPHWFDYNKVAAGPRWRDLTGNYTRFGDVLDLLSDADNRYIISNAGDEISIAFDATSLPVLPSGWTRDYVIYSVGWVKDGDLNTAYGNTVGPLPYHGLSQYPYGNQDSYPEDPVLQQYQKEYNTRRVTTEQFENYLKP